MTEAEFVLIEGAWFVMGSEDGGDDERPVHRVWVDSFEIGACQVTNAEYALFTSPRCRNDSRLNDPQQPVVAVSWSDAVRYCEWRNSLGDGSYRLPTEAEWELAARGGIDGRRYPWGDDLPEDSRRQLTGPDRVGRRPPNGYGLFDLCANVHEWCNDWYGAHYYAVSPERNPRGPETGTRRVSRGGSWRHQITVTRCAARSSISPEFRYADYGFRLARDVKR